MKKKTKKLVLAKETLRELTSGDLRDAVGQVTAEYCTMDTACCTTIRRTCYC